MLGRSSVSDRLVLPIGRGLLSPVLKMSRMQSPRLAGEPLRLLVLGEGWPVHTWLAAELAHRNVIVHRMTSDVDAVPLGSEVFASETFVSAPTFDAAEDEIRALARQHRIHLVLPMSERWMLALAYTTLSEFPAFPSLTPTQRVAVGSKHAMSALAAAAGVAVPRSRVLRNPLDLKAAVKTFGFPFVLKGDRGCGGSAVHIVHSAEELAAVQASLPLDDPLIVTAQAWIREPTVMATGLFVKGRPCRVWLARKTELWPLEIGPSTEVETIQDPRLLEPFLRLAARLEWNGFASADFIQEPSGACIFLELNPRPWGAMAAARFAGVDFVGPLVEILRGEDPTCDLTFRAGVRIRLFPQHLDARLRRRPFVGALSLLDPREWRAAWGLDSALRRTAVRSLIWSFRSGMLTKHPQMATGIRRLKEWVQWPSHTQVIPIRRNTSGDQREHRF
jgi:predicted ATP-grasp superfamily ATP-dependent carboligase